ncbi:hypothetical protein OHB00_16995 [Streptomyces sp. NBC_00631]|uniref:hypothetical protein n=1 Tax=Streptomyces sp. NBC_00631 TaxID=2975793 RepID=UPI0030E1ADC7
MTSESGWVERFLGGRREDVDAPAGGVELLDAMTGRTAVVTRESDGSRQSNYR